MVIGLIRKIVWVLLFPLNYLFYKIQRIFSFMTMSGRPTQHMAFMGALLLTNIITVYVGLWNIMPPYWLVVLVILILLPYAIPKVSDRIVSRFINESENSKIIGYVVVIAYIIISITLLILVS